MARQPKPHRVKITRYLKDGVRVPSSTPGAVRVTQESETYYAKISGKRVSLHTSEYLEACARLRKLLADGPDPQQAHRKRPLEEHLEAFAAHLAAKGTGAKRAAQLLHDLRWLARAAGWDKLPSLSAEGLESTLARLRAEGRAGHTRRSYRQHAVQFAAWCVRTGRLDRNPFLQVAAPRPELDRRYAHRLPTEEELGRLFAYLRAGPRRAGLGASQRAMAYRVCLGTGFRSGELRALRREAFDLDKGVVTLPAWKAKNRKPTVQPLPSWLADELRDYFAAAGPTWEGLPASDCRRQVLEPDLNGAGIAVSLPGPEAPERFTWHSFRVHFIDQLCRDPRNSLKTVMDLARHADAKLTLGIYARHHADDARGALGRLPPPGTVR